MTLKIRRALLSVLTIADLAAVAGVILTWVARSRGLFGAVPTGATRIARWWTLWRPTGADEMTWVLAGLSFFAAFPLLAELVLRRRFGRSPSPEIFFLRVFLLTLPLQVSRLIVPPVLDGLLPAAVGLMAARIAWFGRFMGLAALLNVGLFSTDIPFRRSGPVLGMSVLASMAVAAMLPLDVTQPTGNLLYRSGAEIPLALVCVSMEFLAVLSLGGVALTQKNRRYSLLAGAMIPVVVGTDMASFLTRPLLVPGAALMVVGVLLFARETRKIYQWI